MESQLQELLDRQAISDVMMRYARGIDRFDMDMVRSCYHPGATDDHGSFKGPIEEFIPWVETRLEEFDSIMHFLGNMLIELEGDTAHVETYCVSYHRLKGQDVDTLFGLRYVDRFERRAGDWRIAERRIAAEWNRRDDVDAPGFGPEFIRGERAPADIVYDR
ncbi:MAG: nuclear transport factor 2 family protein [Acidimicrobiales bacterium]